MLLPVPPLFAWFSNPMMLWGLGAASLPILLHLFNRRRYREMPWAAMRFLLAAIQKNRRRVRIEQWLLLAVRTLVVILVVLAMAKPVLESQGAIPLLPGQRTHWVLVLDASMSMAQTSGETNRFDDARALAGQLVRAMRQGDGASVVLMGDPPRVVIGAPAFQRSAALKEIAEIRLPHGGTNLKASFDAVEEVLAASEIPRKEIVFLTDLQAASWDPAGSGSSEALRRTFDRLAAQSVRSSVIDLGAPDDSNHAVTDLRLDPPIVTPGLPATVRATIRRFGPEASLVPVRLIVNGRIVREETLSLGADGEEAVAFPCTFDSAGDHIVEVQLDEDSLPLDDRRLLAVDVREAIRVLVIDGDPRVESLKSETAFLTAALSPAPEPGAEVSPAAATPIRVEVASESQLAGQDLAPYDVVVLCNVARFTATEVASLDAYLKQGGGLVVFGGDEVVPENYNALLFADGKGLLPAELGATAGDTSGQIAPLQFDPLEFRHPIVALFYGEPPGVTASLTNVKTARYHRLRLPEGTSARVALAFSSGDPAIVEAPRHRGRVVLVATSADTGWTSWPLHRSYPAVMEQVVLLAATGRALERNVRVGASLVQAFPPTGVGAEATVQRPEGETARVKLQADGDASLLRYGPTELSGVYRAEVGPPIGREIAFTANVDPAESNPAKLGPSELKAALPGWEFVYDDDWRPLQENAASVGQRGEFHRPLLWGVLTLLLTESLMAWAFGHHTPRVR